MLLNYRRLEWEKSSQYFTTAIDSLKHSITLHFPPAAFTTYEEEKEQWKQL